MSDGAPSERDSRRLARFRMLDAVWSRQSRLTTAERAVATVVARHMNPAGTAFPGYPCIAAETGLSRRTVVKCMLTLVNGDPKRGVDPLLLRRRRRRPDGKSRGYVYEIVSDPAALVAARTEVGAIMANLTGSAKGRDARVNQETSDRVAEIHSERVLLQAAHFKGDVGAREYDRQSADLDRRLRSVATSVRRSRSASTSTVN